MDTATTELIDASARAALDVFDGTRVFMAYVYGSRIHGTPRPDSDLDIGYYLSGSPPAPPLSLREELALAGDLSDRIGVSVDLRYLGAAPLELRGRVLEDGARLYCSDEVGRVNLERNLLSRYHDYKSKFAYWRRLRLRAIASKGL